MSDLIHFTTQIFNSITYYIFVLWSSYVQLLYVARFNMLLKRELDHFIYKSNCWDVKSNVPVFLYNFKFSNSPNKFYSINCGIIFSNNDLQAKIFFYGILNKTKCLIVSEK